MQCALTVETCLRLCFGVHHPVIDKLHLQQFILVWDDEGHVDSVVDVHESCCRVFHSHPEQM